MNKEQRIRHSDPVIVSCNMALETQPCLESTWQTRLRTRSLASYGSPSPPRLSDASMMMRTSSDCNQSVQALEPMDVDVDNGESTICENHENSNQAKSPDDDEDGSKENRNPEKNTPPSKRNNSKVFRTRFSLRTRPLRIPNNNIDNRSSLISPVSLVGLFVHTSSGFPLSCSRNTRNGVRNYTSCYRMSDKVTVSNVKRGSTKEIETIEISSDSDVRSSDNDSENNDDIDDDDASKFEDEDELPCQCPPNSPKMTWKFLKEVYDRTKDMKQLDVVSKSPLLKISVTLLELNYLLPNEWISDSIVDFYIQLIQQRSQNNAHLLKVYSFGTTFYPLLAGETGLDETAETTDGVDIFTFDLALIPICVSDHWRLVAVDFVRCFVTMLNSKTCISDNKILLNISKYIDAEYLRKYKCQDSREWIQKTETSAPQQSNNDDCGIFTLQFAEYLSRGVELSFSQDHITYFRHRIMYEILFSRLLTEV